ncbi:RNA polymerase sigma-70 factor [Mycobacterium sp. NPDC003449]
MAAPDDSSDAAGLSDAAAVFARVRPQLFGIAYRMLGGVAEAEDVVQDTWLRWQTADRAAVRDPVAFLVTVATRICLNALQSARARRETYIGPWIPEPVDTAGDPALGAERGAALELATLMLLERLAAPERAAYILREAFEYPYELIAQAIAVSETNARQLVSRARRHLTAQRAARVDEAERRRLLEAFVAAAQHGDLAGLEAVLAADVISYTDGNGARNATTIPLLGRERVARVVRAFRPRFWPGTTLRWITANGQAAVLVSRDDAVMAFITGTASATGLDRVLWVVSPDKLTHIGTADPL